MSIVVPNNAEVALLDGSWNGLADDFDLRLYRTDVTDGLTPTQIQALDETDFVEANFAGYAAIALASGGWTITASGPTTGVHSPQTFTRSSTGAVQTIYGYWVTDDATGDIRWFERFPTPLVVEFLNDQIVITPTLSLDDREGSTVTVGEIVGFGGATPPAGWLLCQGQAVSRSTYALLFAVIGTSYGVGDGSTTFNVPDLRQRFPLGKAASGTGSTLGGTGGAINHTHALDTSTSHAKVNTKAVVGNEFSMRRKTVTSWTATHGMTAANHQTDTNSQTVGAELGGSSDTENPPYQVVNYMIRAI